MPVLLECCYIWMESSQLEQNWNHLLFCEVSLLTVPHCGFWGVGQGMKQTYLPPWLGWPLWIICVTNDHGWVPLVVNTSRSFPHSWLITDFVTRYTRWVSPVEQKLFD
jgi:hypothetical protein